MHKKTESTVEKAKSMGPPQAKNEEVCVRVCELQYFMWS